MPARHCSCALAHRCSSMCSICDLRRLHNEKRICIHAVFSPKRQPAVLHPSAGPSSIRATCRAALSFPPTPRISFLRRPFIHALTSVNAKDCPSEHVLSQQTLPGMPSYATKLPAPRTPAHCCADDLPGQARQPRWYLEGRRKANSERFRQPFVHLLHEWWYFRMLQTSRIYTMPQYYRSQRNVHARAFNFFRGL